MMAQESSEGICLNQVIPNLDDYVCPEPPISGCMDYRHYAPLVSSETPVKIIRMVFHVLQDANGLNNFSNSATDQGYLWAIRDKVNYYLKNNGQQTPLDPNYPSTFIKDTRLQIEVYPTIFYWTGICFNTNIDNGLVQAYCVNNNPNLPSEYKDGAIHVYFGNCYLVTQNNMTILDCKNTSGDGFGAINLYNYFNNITNASIPSDIYNGSLPRHLTHELGHVLGLAHAHTVGVTATIDNCCDTPNPMPQGESNNFMDYGAKRAFTECQIARMHYNLANKCGSTFVNSNFNNVYKNNKTNYCIKNKLEIVVIDGNQNVIWEGEKRLNTDVIIKKGSELTIKCTVGMATDASIIVEQGARLIIDGGRITHNSSFDCNCKGQERWRGIFAEGNPKFAHSTKMQSPTYPLSMKGENPGIVLLLNKATIEASSHGVNAQGLDYVNNTLYGGLVYANDAVFTNNTTAIVLAPYTLPTASKIEKSTFTTGTTGILAGGQNEFMVEGCSFSKLARYGIMIGNSSASVTKNTFEGLNYGLLTLATQPLTGDIRIGSKDILDENTFKKNKTGVYAVTINMLNVLQNHFTENNFGVAVLGESQFNIEKNKFYGQSKARIDLVNTGVIKGQKSSSCNIPLGLPYGGLDENLGIDISGENLGYSFHHENFLVCKANVILSNEGTTPGRLPNFGKKDNAMWNYFYGDNNILTIGNSPVIPATKQFTYYYPQKSLAPIKYQGYVRPLCDLLTPCNGQAYNFEAIETKGGDVGCLPITLADEAEPSCEWLYETPSGRICLDTCRSFECWLTIRQWSIKLDSIQQATGTSQDDDAQAQLKRIQNREAAIYWTLIDEHLRKGDTTFVEKLLLQGSSTEAYRALIGLKITNNQLEAATKLLDSYVVENEVDKDFVRIQQINIERLKLGIADSMSFEKQLKELRDLSTHRNPSSAYAQAIVAYLTGDIVAPELTPIPEEMEKGNFREGNAEKTTTMDATQLSVQPNPANNKVIVDIPMAWTKESTIELYNNVGTLLQKIECNNLSTHSIDSSNYSDGFYTILLRQKNIPIAQKKLIIQH